MFTDIFENIDYGVTSVDLTLDDELKPRVLPILDEGRYGKDLPEEQIIAEWLEIIAEEDNEFLAGEPDLLVEDYDWGDPLEGQALVLENLSIKYNEFRQRMKRFQSKINNNSTLKVVKIDGPQGTAKNGDLIRPQRKFGVVLQRVIWHLNDGQTITAVFEVEGADGLMLKDEHVLSSFIWKINGIDITRFLFKSLTVDDERGGGRGLTERQLAQRLGRYVEQNAENFAKKKAGNDAARAELDADTAEVDRLTQELDTLNKGSEQSENKKVFQEQQLERLGKDIEDLKRQIREAGGVPDGDDEEIAPPPPPPTDEEEITPPPPEEEEEEFDELDPANYTGLESVDKLVNHPSVVQSLTNLNNALVAIGMENLNPTIFGRSPSAGGDVFTLQIYLKELIARSTESGESLDLDDALGFIIEMLNNRGLDFFSDPISNYMKDNGLGFFNLYEISGTINNVVFHLDRDLLMRIHSQLDTGETEEEEETDSRYVNFPEYAALFDKGDAVEWYRVGGDTWEKGTYQGVDTDGRALITWEGGGGSAPFSVYHNRMSLRPDVDFDRGGDRRNVLDNFLQSVSEMNNQILQKKAGPIYDSFYSAAAMLLRYHNQSVAGSGIGETVTMEEMIEMLRESVHDRMEAAHDKANATYEKLLPEVITASVLFALGQQVREMANEYEMDTGQIDVIKNQQTGAYEYSYTADDLGDNSDDDVEPDEVEPDEVEPDETDSGGGDLEAQVNEILKSEDPVYIADMQEELEDALEAAGREDLLDAMDERMNELSQRD
jgi:hypothetical protein